MKMLFQRLPSFLRQASRAALTTSAVVVGLSGCDSPSIPLSAAPYDFRLAVSVEGGPTELRTFHWPVGSTVRVFIAENVEGRPSLVTALAGGTRAWNQSAPLGLVRVEPTTDLGQAHAVLLWSDTQPVTSVPPTCVGPVGGGAGTRGCLSEEGDRILTLTRRDGGDSKVLLVTTIQLAPDLDQDLLDRIVAHEMGHVLGILNHSPDPSDLMWPGDLLTLLPTPADQATLTTLYQTKVDLAGG